MIIISNMNKRDLFTNRVASKYIQGISGWGVSGRAKSLGAISEPNMSFDCTRLNPPSGALAHFDQASQLVVGCLSRVPRQTKAVSGKPSLNLFDDLPI